MYMYIYIYIYIYIYECMYMDTVTCGITGVPISPSVQAHCLCRYALGSKVLEKRIIVTW
jgi:hypothetical protein